MVSAEQITESFILGSVPSVMLYIILITTPVLHNQCYGSFINVGMKIRAMVFYYTPFVKTLYLPVIQSLPIDKKPSITAQQKQKQQ